MVDDRTALLGIGALGAAVALSRRGGDGDDGGPGPGPAPPDDQPPERMTGGGDYYSDVVPRSDAHFVVSTIGELKDALNDAFFDEVVWVDGEINIGSERITVPDSVVLASGRGTEDTTGTIRVTGNQEGALLVEDEARVTGLRILGNNHDNINGYTQSGSGIGLLCVNDQQRIDNNIISGHAWTGVRAGEAIVEHNRVLKSGREGLGYGIYSDFPETNDSDTGTVIRRNHISHCRHMIAGPGTDASYTAHDNLITGPMFDHCIDMHQTDGTAGDEIYIHHNRVEPFVIPQYVDRNPGEVTSAVLIRGVPITACEVHHNWFWNPDDPVDTICGDGVDDWDCPAVNQQHVSTLFTGMDVHDNAYGEAPEPPDDVGIRPL